MRQWNVFLGHPIIPRRRRSPGVIYFESWMSKSKLTTDDPALAAKLIDNVNVNVKVIYNDLIRLTITSWYGLKMNWIWLKISWMWITMSWIWLTIMWCDVMWCIWCIMDFPVHIMVFPASDHFCHFSIIFSFTSLSRGFWPFNLCHTFFFSIPFCQCKLYIHFEYTGLLKRSFSTLLKISFAF